MLLTFQDLYNFSQKVDTFTVIPMEDDDIAQLHKLGSDISESVFWDKVRDGYHLAVWRRPNRKRTYVELSKGKETVSIVFRPDSIEVREIDDYGSTKNMPIHRFAYTDTLWRSVNRTNIVRKRVFGYARFMDDKAYLKWATANKKAFQDRLESRKQQQIIKNMEEI